MNRRIRHESGSRLSKDNKAERVFTRHVCTTKDKHRNKYYFHSFKVKLLTINGLNAALKTNSDVFRRTLKSS